MKNFFSSLFRWLGHVRNLVLNTVFVLFLAFLVLALIAGHPQLPDRAALILDPAGNVVEETRVPGPGMLPLEIGIPAPQQTELSELIRVIRHAGKDEHIRLMVLKLDELGHVSLPGLQSLRRALEEFKASGKSIIAVGPQYTQSQYYLAATADRLYLGPMGFITLEGFSIYRHFFKDALERLHVHLNLFRAGRFKSAAEPLIRNDMSDADREANAALLQVLWDAYKKDIAEMRGIRPERLQQLLDDPARFLASHDGSLTELALAEKLADAVLDRSGIEAAIAEALGSSDEDYPRIHYRQYRQLIGDEEPSGPNRIGLITASGMILDGEQPPGTVGDVPMAEMLKKARRGCFRRAVVLRIDSPGGSASSSESIRREILRLKQAGKPVVVSIGGMAASGGYWIASPADEIWARPTSITGSIGAFGLLADVKDGLERLGIHTDGLGTTRIAGGIRPDRRLPQQLAEVMQQSIQHVYRRFLDVVAEGRHMDRSKVADLAEGRAWSGQDARRLGLVDHLGGLDEAIRAAARLAGIEQEYDVQKIRRPQGLGDILLRKLLGSADAWLASTSWLRLIGPDLSARPMQHILSGGIWAFCDLSVR